MQSDFFDNKTRIVRDDIADKVKKGDKIAVASSIFSIYAFNELHEQLKDVEEFRFLFTSPTFTKNKAPKEKREFYIPRHLREQGLFGTELEIKLRNELTQKALATECVEWIRSKATFKSFPTEDAMGNTFLAVEGDDTFAYTPFNGFTTSELGTEKSSTSYRMVMRPDAETSKELLHQFNQAWNSGVLDDVTEAVIEGMTAMYQENAPELIYYMALFRIFNEFLDDISQDVLPNEGVGYRESAIWNKLYDFQRDAVLAIINKLETYNGCILADSVGLGKTFTALAVIKYYESRNRNVLVLCPKKLQENWTTYNNNLVNNPIASDQLRYDVLFHTDLSRERGTSATGIPFDRINWGAYDLVVIDESHNFRNGSDTASAADDKMNRYQMLMEKVIKKGVKTKVLMLSATPVNNRFRDLRNQLALAYSGDPTQWEGKLDLNNDIDTIFRMAQTTFTKWSGLPPEQRTTATLTDMLDFDFFEVLDQVTVARSRKHIQRYYDMSALGPFPERNKPISKRPKLTTLENAINYREIYDELDDLTLSVYMPSSFLHQSKVSKYTDEEGNLTIAGRESGIRKLMNVNLLKRLESSVHAFRLTLKRVLSTMETTLARIDDFKAARIAGGAIPGFSADDYDLDFEDEDSITFEVGGNTKIDLSDMDWMSYERSILEDVEVIKLLISMVEDIDPAHDAKLLELFEDVREKVENPINPDNKKVLIFTAFADTANYLFENLSKFARDELGLETAMVAGSSCKSTVKKLPAQMHEILTCFSPESKERDLIASQFANTDIDIVIATDCISEGQNLQDCDYMVNYDIHWNPVRIVQRFGRIDRIGSKNERIQLVNYWPDVELDEYIQLKARVEDRMRITVLTSTGDDDYINEEEKGDLEYRERQLRQMRDEVVDLEDVNGGVSITDLGLNEFRMDLVAYYDENPDIDKLPSGIHAVVEGDDPGIVFILRNVNDAMNPRDSNHLHPFYVVCIGSDGTPVYNHLQPKSVLDAMRQLCKGKSEPIQELCRAFNKETKNGRDMRACSRLLKDAVASIIDAKEESDVDSFFSGGTTTFLTDSIEGLDDFELICFLVVKPKC